LHPASAVADTIVWNRHLADAARLEIAVNWGRDIPFVVEIDWDLPGGRKGLGNMTGPLLRALHTASVPVPPHSNPARGRLMTKIIYDHGFIDDDLAIVTSFSPTNAFVLNPATAMKIDHLGDEGDTNWAFQHLQHNMGLVGSQGLTPHVQSTRPDGRIFFEPGGHHPDQFIPELPHLTPDPQRSRYTISWFGNNHWVFKFGVHNNVTVVIPMNRLTLCSPNYAVIPPETWAATAYYVGLLELFLNAYGIPAPEDYNVELPTLQDVKADANAQNAR
jgi:hypothetical protein